MTTTLRNSVQSLHSVIDFLRFGLSSANAANLYYGHGTDNAWDEIWALVLGSLSLPLDLDPLLLQGRLTDDEKSHLAKQLHRRIVERVPVPYLTHRAYFCDLLFCVDERVLIPRSPLAEIIKQQFVPWIDPTTVHHVLDLCTGSGCIAIACCYAFPEALVDAVDISADALAVAAINRDRHELQDTLTLIESDCFDAVPVKQYDVIISNPPYVGEAEMQTLPAEYRHEPTLALLSDHNGLAFVERLLNQAQAYLSDEGILVVEVGNSDEALMDAYPDVPFMWLEFEHGGHGVFVLTGTQVRTYFSSKS